MKKLIFINLPVRNLTASTAFYRALGAEQNMQFSDESGSCMVLSDVIHVMLLTQDKFRGFTNRPVADAKKTTQVLLALSEESRPGVDGIVERARAAGGGVDPGPTQDHGFMYCRSFEDLDGHIWEVVWMDMEAATAAMGASKEAV